MDQVQTADKAQNRKPRDLEGRQVMQRPTAWQVPEALPSPDPRPDWSHRWIRTSTLGQSDAANISSKFREGYEPCKADEYPELMMHASTDGRFKGNIEIGGLLLCKIPKEFMEQRAAFYTKASADQLTAVDNSFMQQNDARMPLFRENRSSVTFGSGKK